MVPVIPDELYYCSLHPIHIHIHTIPLPFFTSKANVLCSNISNFLLPHLILLHQKDNTWVYHTLLGLSDCRSLVFPFIIIPVFLRLYLVWESSGELIKMQILA